MYGHWNMDVDGYSQPTYMQECVYPIDYHQAYGHTYSQPARIEHVTGMTHPIMYPEIYYKVYPYASQICDKLDNPYVIYPSEQLLEKMIDDCYDICIDEMPELEKYAGIVTTKDESVETKQRNRGSLLRDLIAIILLAELFKRRERSPWVWEGHYNGSYMW